MSENPNASVPVDVITAPIGVAPDAVLKKIRNAWIAAAISAGITLSFVFLAISGTSIAGVSAWEFLDVALAAGLAFGIYKKSRTCAVAMLVYFIISRVLVISETGKLGSIVIALAFLYFFVQGVIGTFAYHKHIKRPETGDRNSFISTRRLPTDVSLVESHTPPLRIEPSPTASPKARGEVVVDRYNVIVLGTTLPEHSIGEVTLKLASLIGRDVAFAAQLLRGKQITVKSDIDAATGARYVAALERIGAAARLDLARLDIADEVFESESPAAVRRGRPARPTVGESVTATGTVPTTHHEQQRGDDKPQIRFLMPAGIAFLVGVGWAVIAAHPEIGHYPRPSVSWIWAMKTVLGIAWGTLAAVVVVAVQGVRWMIRRATTTRGT
jgi:hypothetical protein